MRAQKCGKLLTILFSLPGSDKHGALGLQQYIAGRASVAPKSNNGARISQHGFGGYFLVRNELPRGAALKTSESPP
jgi:hypothetical protein